jgi:enoyl-[acyl-carrier protein] reductase I
MVAGLLEGKNGLILGVANQRSIAWAIARSASEAGARLAFTYQGERLEENVRSLAETLPGSLVLPCDVSDGAQIDAVFDALRRDWGRLDFLVHSIAFAPRADLEGDFADTSREGFRIALEVSAYSLVSLARAAAPLMTGPEGGSIVALTYLGSVRAVPGYNVMGVAKAALESSVRYLALDLGPRNIRVNAISAGPINTLAARGVSGFTAILSQVRERAPLKRNTEAAEVGDAAVFFFSSLSRGVTGDVLYVDSGYHILGI